MKVTKLTKGLLIAVLMMVTSVSLFAQDPSTPIEWLTKIPEMLGSFGGTFLGLILLTPALIGILNVVTKTLKYLVTGAIGLALVLAAYFLSFGFLNGSPWYAILIAFVLMVGGQIAGYAIPFLKPIWDAIEDKFNWRT